MRAIVNVGPDWGIGNSGALLWSIPEDLRRFRQLTTGGVVVLGRKTLATFPGGRPLKNRVNLVLSGQPDLIIEGAVVLHSIEALLEEVNRYKQPVWVIGGDSVYRQLLPWCDTVELTRTYGRALADTFFPDLDMDPAWRQTDLSPLYDHGGVPFRYITYRRVV